MTAVVSSAPDHTPARLRSRRGGPAARAIAWLTDEPENLGTDSGSRPAHLADRLAAAGRSHPMVADALLAGALALVSTPFIARHASVPTGSMYVIEAALIIPLIWRRRYPVGVFVFLCAVGLTQWVFADRMVADAAVLVSLYTVASRCPRRIALLGAGTIEAGVVIGSFQHVLGGSWARSLVYLTATVTAAFLLGTNMHTRRQYLAALVERAHRLEHDRDQQAAIAVAAERASIAREMHDIVAHSLAVIITMADAAVLKRRSDPDRAESAMRQVSETGRQALGETRRLLGVLRTDPAPGDLAPQPGLAQLDTLLDQVRATGLAAELTVAGQRFPIPDGAQLAAYRIVQEALTNTLKHARDASTVHVTVGYADTALEIVVTNDGHAAPATHPHLAGHGLVGMRERAVLYDGDVLAGPQPSGGWAVRARLDLARPQPAP